MSNPGTFGQTVCSLPYTTTHVEFEVLEPGTGEPLLAQSFPAVYGFVAAR